MALSPATGPAPEPHPAYVRQVRELALIMIENGHTPDGLAFAPDAAYIGGIYGELTREGTGPREAAVMLRRLRTGLSVIDGGGQSIPGPRPALRLVRGR